MNQLENNSALEKEKLKPCPFCGGVATLEHSQASGAFQVRCEGKKCHIWPETYWDHSEEWVRSMWNRRVCK